MDERINAEFEILRGAYPNAVLQDRWILLPGCKLVDGWVPSTVDIAIFLPPPYPGISPYGIYVAAAMTFNGTTPQNYTQANPSPPFPGTWSIFSWEAEAWQPGSKPDNGQNILTWVDGIRKRFLEGV